MVSLPPLLRSFAIEDEGIVLAWLSIKLTSLEEDLRLLEDLSKVHPLALIQAAGSGNSPAHAPILLT
eukprot:735967-Hanusia_phi.AAC.1